MRYSSDKNGYAPGEAFKEANSLTDHAKILSNMMKKSTVAKPILPQIDKEAIYAGLDPVLSILFKEWKSSVGQYKALRNQFGDDDMMVDVAIERMDAARLSFETRLLEVKADKKLYAKAEKLWDAAQELELPEEDEEEITQEQLMELEQQWQYFAKTYGMKARDGRSSNFAFFLFLLAILDTYHFQIRMRQMEAHARLIRTAA